MTSIEGKDAKLGTAEWNTYSLDVRRVLAWRRLNQLVDHGAIVKSGAKFKDPVAKLIQMVNYIENKKNV